MPPGCEAAPPCPGQNQNADAARTKLAELQAAVQVREFHAERLFQAVLESAGSDTLPTLCQ